MYLISTENESGVYPPPQTTCAPGLLYFPVKLLPIFYPPDKQCAGFVTIAHDGTAVTSCVWNEEAYQAYLAGLPEPEPPIPTEAEDAAALLVDHEYRLTLLELGITETTV